jgi:hypothetical protein
VVPNPRKTPGPDTFKPVNTPEPLDVEENSSGLPVAVKTRRRQAITAVEDKWRIDDEWWRSEPVSRLYYAVLLTSGQRLVLYKDLTDGRWYRQAY